MAIEQLEPRECFRWFEEIARIPRCSSEEKAMGDWLVAFAGERNLDAVRDGSGNVCIRKPGTPGMETAPAVILQGHMDMVCVKAEGADVDFTKDPIRLKLEGDRLSAQGTTLGADNGIALAFLLALLDARDISHPPLEAVFTVEEEVGMAGAAAFDVCLLRGTRFINLDSEEEGVFCVSCAGGRRSELSLPLEETDVASLPGADKLLFYTVALGGLAGGHSGMEIDKQRGNAAVLAGRVLAGLAARYDCHLADIAAGSASNVIPSECRALVALPCLEDELAAALGEIAETLRHEFAASDGEGLTLRAEKAVPFRRVFTRGCAEKILMLLALIPDGVVTFDLNMTEQRMVESSSNLGMVTRKGNALVFSCLTRSSLGSKKEFICAKIAALARLTGGEVSFFGDYPAWEYQPESPLRETFMRTYKDLFGEEARAEGIHAGLECGLFYEKFRAEGRDMDFIAFGPDIRGAHTVRESVSVSSVERMWRMLLEALRRLGTA